MRSQVNFGLLAAAAATVVFYCCWLPLLADASTICPRGELTHIILNATNQNDLNDCPSGIWPKMEDTCCFNCFMVNQSAPIGTPGRSQEICASLLDVGYNTCSDEAKTRVHEVCQSHFNVDDITVTCACWPFAGSTQQPTTGSTGLVPFPAPTPAPTPTGGATGTTAASIGCFFFTVLMSIHRFAV